MNRPTITLNKRIRKSHYDTKQSVQLQFKNGALFNEQNSSGMSAGMDYTMQPEEESNQAFQFSANDINDHDDDSSFSESHEFAMAKAFDEDEMEEENAAEEFEEQSDRRPNEAPQLRQQKF